MKRLLPLALVALLGVTVPVQAAKTNKVKKGQKQGQVLNRFDRDQSGAIDGDEVARVQAAFATLSALDLDHNGQLSDSELAAAKITPGKRKKKAK